MRIDVVTIFPALFDPFLRESFPGRALRLGLIRIEVHDLLLGFDFDQPIRLVPTHESRIDS